MHWENGSKIYRYIHIKKTQHDFQFNNLQAIPSLEVYERKNSRKHELKRGPDSETEWILFEMHVEEMSKSLKLDVAA